MSITLLEVAFFVLHIYRSVRKRRKNKRQLTRVQVPYTVVALHAPESVAWWMGRHGKVFS